MQFSWLLLHQQYCTPCSYKIQHGKQLFVLMARTNVLVIIPPDTWPLKIAIAMNQVLWIVTRTDTTRFCLLNIPKHHES
jgi:hypothetical protein